ncbi:MAG: GAF domain-containing sensor histidine kinase [bacterium]|nr:GAF domain-containing sensor histidine kinase [bacterium]
MFEFLSKKQKKEDSSVQEDLKSITENLYQQNHQLAVTNKTLSLLRQLYQISILELEPTPLCEKIVFTVKEALELELVSIYIVDDSRLKPLAISLSNEFASDLKESKVDISGEITEIQKNDFFIPLLHNRVNTETHGIDRIWYNNIDEQSVELLNRKTHIKSFFAYPLMIDGELVAVLLLGEDRDHEKLSQFEKDTISSFVDVIAVALNKAFLYKELTATNKKLKTANLKLTELDQLKTEFISLATHQIRAPLTAIKGYISLIREGDYGDVSTEVDSALGVVSESTNNLVTIVGDFLDVSRIEQGRMKYDFSDFNVDELVQQVITEYKPNVDRRGLVLNFTHDQNSENFVHADRGKLKQIFGNILDNSIKYTQQGSIDVSVTKKDDRILIKVADTGVGIPENTIPKLFQKFTRASNANEANILGTGLGLYVAKQMIEAHEGRIWAESEGSGKGSQFYIELKAIDKAHTLSGHLSIPPASSII